MRVGFADMRWLADRCRSPVMRGAQVLVAPCCVLDELQTLDESGPAEALNDLRQAASSAGSVFRLPQAASSS